MLPNRAGDASLPAASKTSRCRRAAAARIDPCIDHVTPIHVTSIHVTPEPGWGGRLVAAVVRRRRRPDDAAGIPHDHALVPANTYPPPARLYKDAAE